MVKEKYKIMRNREVMMNPGYWNGIGHTSPKTRKIYGAALDMEWFAFNNGRGKSFFLKQDWEEKEKYISNKLFKNKKYFEEIKKETEKGISMAESFIDKLKKLDYSELDFKELINLLDEIKNVWLAYDVASVLSWYLGGDRFKELISAELNLPEKDFLVLTTPTEKTMVSKLEYDLCKYPLLVKNKKIDLEKAADKLSDKYGWIPFGYDGPVYWDKKYFIDKLNKQARGNLNKLKNEALKIEKFDKKILKKRNALIKNYGLTKNQLDLVNIADRLGVWTDDRKKLHFKLHYYYAQALLELGKRHDMPYKNLKYLFPEELKNIKKSRDKLLEVSNKRIDNEFMLEYKNGRGKILPERQKNRILKELKNQNKPKNIKGMVASRGKKNFYKGYVKIILSPKDGDKIKKGDFLVATMTSPDYIASMKKAAGFITDEGGVTCHAAIVAREMNKPCVIGTKIATQVLRDGDLVEIDVNNGIVKILNRKK